MAATEEVEVPSSSAAVNTNTIDSTLGFDISIFESKTYCSIDEAHRAMVEHALTCGFAIRKRRDNKSKRKGRIAGVTKVVYVCSCEGIYRNSRPDLTDETRKRQCVSKRTGCKWAAFLKLRDDKKWVIIFKNVLHNHLAFDDLLLSSTSRRLLPEAKQMVESSAQSRIKAAWQAIRAVETYHPKHLKSITRKSYARKMAPYLAAFFESKKPNVQYADLEEIQAPNSKRQKIMYKSIEKHGNIPEEVNGCNVEMLCSDVLQDAPDSAMRTEIHASLADLDSDHMHSVQMSSRNIMPENVVHEMWNVMSAQQEIDRNLTVSNSDAIVDLRTTISNADAHTVVLGRNDKTNFSEVPPTLRTARIEVDNSGRKWCSHHSDVDTRRIDAHCFRLENIMQFVSEAEFRFDEAWRNFYSKVHDLFSQDVAQIHLSLGELLKSKDDNSIIQSAIQIKSAHQAVMQQIQKFFCQIKILQSDRFNRSKVVLSHQFQEWEKQLKDLVLDKLAVLSQTTIDVVGQNALTQAQMLSLLDIEQRKMKEDFLDGHIFLDPQEFQKIRIEHEASLKKLMDNFLKSLIDALHNSISEFYSTIESCEEEVMRKKVQTLEAYNSELKAQCKSSTQKYNNLQTRYDDLNQRFLELKQSKVGEERKLRTKIRKLETGLQNMKQSLLHTVMQNSDLEFDSD